MRPYFVYIEGDDESVTKKAVAVRNEKDAKKRFANNIVVAVKAIEGIEIDLNKIGEALTSGGIDKTEKEILLDIISQSGIMDP